MVTFKLLVWQATKTYTSLFYTLMHKQHIALALNVGTGHIWRGAKLSDRHKSYGQWAVGLGG